MDMELLDLKLDSFLFISFYCNCQLDLNLICVFFTPFADVRYTKTVIVNNKLICYGHNYGHMQLLVKKKKVAESKGMFLVVEGEFVSQPSVDNNFNTNIKKKKT